MYMFKIMCNQITQGHTSLTVFAIKCIGFFIHSGVEVKAGDHVKAVVIHVDIQTKSLEFSLDSKLIGNIEKYKDTPSSQVWALSAVYFTLMCLIGFSA